MTIAGIPQAPYQRGEERQRIGYLLDHPDVLCLRPDNPRVTGPVLDHDDLEAEARRLLDRI